MNKIAPMDEGLLKSALNDPQLLAQIAGLVQKAAITTGTYTFSPASRSIFVAENLASTLMGCQGGGRRCYTSDLDPKYFHAGIKRFMRFYPDIPVKCLTRDVDMSLIKGV